MESEKKYPHMCGGVLATILLSYRRKMTGELNQNHFYADLARIVKPRVELPAENVLKTVASEYSNCRKETPGTLPFGDNNYVEAFKRLMRENYRLLLHRTDLFLNKYIDIADKDTRDPLVREIYEILGNDPLCRRNPLLILPDGEVTVFKNISDIHLQPFILGIWFYIISHKVSNRVDSELYDSWRSSKRGRFKLPGDVIVDAVPAMVEEDSLEEMPIPNEEILPEDDEPTDDIETSTVEVYEAPFTDPRTQKQVVAQFHVEAKDNAIAIGQVFGGLIIGKRGGKDE